MRGRLVAGVLIVLCLLPLQALSQNKADGTEPAPTGFSIRELCQRPQRREGTPDKGAQKVARAALLQAKVAYDASNYAEAARALRTALDAVPQVETLFNLAQACREGGAEKEALALYEHVLRAEPEDNIANEAKQHSAALRVSVARSLDQEGAHKLVDRQLDAALEAFREAAQLDVRPLYVFHVAEAQRLRGKREEAARAYERYLNMNGAANDEHQQEAVAHLSRLRADDEVRRAEEHTRASEHAQAMAAWQAAYRHDSRPLYTFRIAESAQKAGVYAEAVASYQRFLRDTQPTEYIAERAHATTNIPRMQREERERRVPIHKRWWLWTALGGVAALAVIGGVTGGTLAAQSNSVLPGIPVENQRVLMQMSLPPY